MKAAWYEEQGPASEVLVVGEMPDPEAGRSGFEITERFSLDGITAAHEFVEHPPRPGRVVLTL